VRKLFYYFHPSACVLLDGVDEVFNFHKLIIQPIVPCSAFAGPQNCLYQNIYSFIGIAINTNHHQYVSELASQRKTGYEI